LGEISFYLGGAKSGKTGLALRAAEQFAAPRFYLATAQALDGEMEERIARHRAERGEGWRTIEEPLDLAAGLGRAPETSAVLVDCLTLWLSNMLGSLPEGTSFGPYMEALERFVALASARPGPAVVVSNEVGGGIVPMDGVSRFFRDVSGLAHQRLAGAADRVFFVAAGLPLRLK
jgi:adenosylcobinamide kinase/adenosylcobinamide-phosphate guanylyltransferase